MKNLLVIQESNTVIGVASTVNRSLEMIKEYFGQNCEITNIQDIRDSGLEYACDVFIGEDDGYNYPVAVYYFTVDENLT